MQFIDLGAQQKRIRETIEEKIKNILDHGAYIMGPEIAELEESLSDYTKASHVLGCSSGTDALVMALMALDVGPGDAVFTTTFSFLASAQVISFLGATPVFVDIHPETFNIDTDKLEKRIAETGLRARGIIAVDLFGLPAEYDKITGIARKHGLFVIEDAAQSFGAEVNGEKACSLGDIACTSFFPAKPLGCYGDGGAVFTNDEALAEKLRIIRVHGQGKERYNSERIGINGRLDSIQAAVLLAKMDIFADEVALRQKVAANYTELLKDIPFLATPRVPEGYKSIWAQYSLLCKDMKTREAVFSALSSAGIPYGVYYPIPLHLQSCFKSLGYKKGDFPVCEDIADRIFSLPMHPYLGEEDQKRIADILGNAI